MLTPVLLRRTFLAGLPALAQTRRPRPNILWLSAEDLSPDLGCYGDAYARTPHLDRFAAEGVRFTNAFSVAGVCAPSRAGIITGMYPTSIGLHHMRSQGVPPPHVKCFPEYLRAAGYYCTNNAKTDYNLGRPDGSVEGLVAGAPVGAWDESGPRAHWRNRTPGQPFFAVFNFLESHEGRIRGEGNAAEALASVPRELRHDPALAKLPPYYPDTPVVRKDWATYYDLVTAVDLRVKTMLDQLAADGLDRDTIVFFWGDHGRGLPRAKRWLYDAGIRVPLLVRWPGQLRAGSVQRELVNLIDLGPTALSLAGVRVPGHLHGRPFLGEQRKKAPRYVFGVRDRMDEKPDRIRSVHDGRLHYLRNYRPELPYAQPIAYMDQMPLMREWRRLHAEGKLAGPQQQFFAARKPEEELYDTTADPHEIRNLASAPEHRAALAKMRAAHERWVRETGDLGAVPEAELKERWRPGGKWSATARPEIEPAGGEFRGPVRVTLRCATEGASLEYSLGERWALYTGPFEIASSARLRVRAGRLGFADSPEVAAEFLLAQNPERR